MSALPVRYEHTDTAIPATLSSAMSNSDVTASCASLTGWPTGAVGKFWAVIGRGTASEEQILVTARSGASLSGITRAQNGTAAVSHSIGDTIEHALVAAEIDLESAHRSSATSVHGVDGAVVGTTSVQTLTGKTLDGDLNTFQDIPQAAVSSLVADLAAKSPITRDPIGMLAPYAGAAAPTNWLICDGAAVSRTTYAALFAVCGTTFGVGDGSTTFNVPDLRGRGVLGVSAGHARGTTGGAETAAIAIANMPSHNHGGASGSTTPTDHSHANTITDGAGAHVHGVKYNLNLFTTGATNASYLNSAFPNNANNTDSAGGHNHTVNNANVSGGAATLAHTHTVASQGSGTALDVLDPFLSLSYIILAL